MNKTSAFSKPLEDHWEMLLHVLPKGWQDAVWTTGTITRLRAIQSATGLLRLIMVYAWNDWSLRNTAAWAKRMGLADLSDRSNPHYLNKCGLSLLQTQFFIT